MPNIPSKLDQAISTKALHNDVYPEDAAEAVLSFKNSIINTIKTKLNTLWISESSESNILKNIENSINHITKWLEELWLVDSDLILLQKKLLSDINVDMRNNVSAGKLHKDMFLQQVLSNETFERLNLIWWWENTEKKDRVFACLYDLMDINYALISTKDKDKNNSSNKKIKLWKLWKDLKYKIDIAQSSEYSEKHKKDILSWDFKYDKDSWKIIAGNWSWFPINKELCSDFIINTVFFDKDGNKRKTIETDIKWRAGESAGEWLETTDWFETLKLIYFQANLYSDELCEFVDEWDEEKRAILKQAERSNFKIKVWKVVYKNNVDTKLNTKINKLLKNKIWQELAKNLISYYDYKETIDKTSEYFWTSQKIVDYNSINSNLKIKPILTEAINISVGGELVKVSSLQDFVKKIYFKQQREYELEWAKYRTKNGRSFRNWQQQHRQVQVSQNIEKEKQEKYNKTIIKAYLHYIIESNGWNLDGSKVLLLKQFGNKIINIDKFDGKAWFMAKKNNTTDVYLDSLIKQNFLSEIESKKSMAIADFKEDPIKWSISVWSLIWAVILTWLVNAATWWSTIWADAGIFYGTEKMIKWVGYGATDLFRDKKWNYIDSFMWGFYEGIWRLDEKGDIKSMQDRVIWEITGYAETLVLFRIVKPLQAIKWIWELWKVGVEAEWFNIAWQLIGTCGEYIRLSAKWETENAKMLLQNSVNNLLDPVEHTRSFGHSFMTLGMLRGVSTMMSPIYKWLSDAQLVEAKNIESKLAESNGISKKAASLVKLKKTTTDATELSQINIKLEALELELYQKSEEIFELQNRFLSANSAVIEEMQYLWYKKYRNPIDIAKDRVKYCENKLKWNISEKLRWELKAKIKFWNKVIWYKTINVDKKIDLVHNVKARHNALKNNEIFKDFSLLQYKENRWKIIKYYNWEYDIEIKFQNAKKDKKWELVGKMQINFYDKKWTWIWYLNANVNAKQNKIDFSGLINKSWKKWLWTKLINEYMDILNYFQWDIDYSWVTRQTKLSVASLLLKNGFVVKDKMKKHWNTSKYELYEKEWKLYYYTESKNAIKPRDNEDVVNYIELSERPKSSEWYHYKSTVYLGKNIYEFVWEKIMWKARSGLLKNTWFATDKISSINEKFNNWTKKAWNKPYWIDEWLRQEYMEELWLSEWQIEIANEVHKFDLNFVLKWKIMSWEVLVRENENWEYRIYENDVDKTDYWIKTKWQNIFSIAYLCELVIQNNIIPKNIAKLLVVDGVCGGEFILDGSSLSYLKKYISKNENSYFAVETEWFVYKIPIESNNDKKKYVIVKRVPDYDRDYHEGDLYEKISSEFDGTEAVTIPKYYWSRKEWWNIFIVIEYIEAKSLFSKLIENYLNNMFPNKKEAYDFKNDKDAETEMYRYLMDTNLWFVNLYRSGGKDWVVIMAIYTLLKENNINMRLPFSSFAKPKEIAEYFINIHKWWVLDNDASNFKNFLIKATWQAVKIDLWLWEEHNWNDILWQDARSYTLFERMWLNTEETFNYYKNLSQDRLNKLNEKERSDFMALQIAETIDFVEDNSELFEWDLNFVYKISDLYKISNEWVLHPDITIKEVVENYFTKWEEEKVIYEEYIKILWLNKGWKSNKHNTKISSMSELHNELDKFIIKANKQLTDIFGESSVMLKIASDISSDIRWNSLSFEQALLSYKKLNDFLTALNGLSKIQIEKFNNNIKNAEASWISYYFSDSFVIKDYLELLEVCMRDIFSNEIDFYKIISRYREQYEYFDVLSKTEKKEIDEFLEENFNTTTTKIIQETTKDIPGIISSLSLSTIKTNNKIINIDISYYIWKCFFSVQLRCSRKLVYLNQIDKHGSEDIYAPKLLYNFLTYMQSLWFNNSTLSAEWWWRYTWHKRWAVLWAEMIPDYRIELLNKINNNIEYHKDIIDLLVDNYPKKYYRNRFNQLESKEKPAQVYLQDIMSLPEWKKRWIGEWYKTEEWTWSGKADVFWWYFGDKEIITLWKYLDEKHIIVEKNNAIKYCQNQMKIFPAKTPFYQSIIDNIKSIPEERWYYNTNPTDLVEIIKNSELPIQFWKNSVSNIAKDMNIDLAENDLYVLWQAHIGDIMWNWELVWKNEWLFGLSKSTIRKKIKYLKNYFYNYDKSNLANSQITEIELKKRKKYDLFFHILMEKGFLEHNMYNKDKIVKNSYNTLDYYQKMN